MMLTEFLVFENLYGSCAIKLIYFQSLFRKHFTKDAAATLHRRPTMKSTNTEYYREATSDVLCNMNRLNIQVREINNRKTFSFCKTFEELQSHD